MEGPCEKESGNFTGADLGYKELNSANNLSEFGSKLFSQTSR